jgi:thioredoxin reductase/Pyruvate/2-oxoacid:ferredoxin oxidoreductase delta subunit
VQQEAFLLWGLGWAVAAAIVTPYVLAFRRRLRRDRERREEAVALGIDKPVAQFPFIDPTHCIGCGACVRACPEGDVLGVVGGSAVVINGLRCVGHGRCAEACPVGAITVGLGDLRGRADVPQADETGETNVPGVYVAGELAGLALVRNAVAQGRATVAAIAGRPRLATDGDDTLDLVISGAGPAGLAAALAAQVEGLSCVVIEREPTLGGSLLHYPRRKMVLTQPVELPPWGALTREEYAKEELLAMLERLVRERGLAVRFGESLLGARRDGDALLVQTSRETLRAGALLLALGRRGAPRKLGVPGEELPKVMYRLLDAEGYRGQRVLVVGGGDSAAEAAIGLAQQPGNVVTLSYRRDKLVRLKRKNQEALEPLLASGAVRACFGSQPLAIHPDRVLLRTADGELELPNDYVFVFAGGEPPFPLLRAMGIAFGGEEQVSHSG